MGDMAAGEKKSAAELRKLKKIQIRLGKNQMKCVFKHFLATADKNCIQIYLHFKIFDTFDIRHLSWLCKSTNLSEEKARPTLAKSTRENILKNNCHLGLARSLKIPK
jgi:hypothetical protein